MRLDLSSLQKALPSLQKAADRSQKAPSDEELRDAVIQRFEYSYELCWKMIKRALEQEAASPAEVDQLSYQDLFRTAAEKGIISKVEPWFEYRQQRNITSHTYDAKKAKKVYDSALKFLKDATALLQTLEKRNAG